MGQDADINELYSFRELLAKLVVANENYAPIFLRIEDEIAVEERRLAAERAGSVLEQARAIAARQVRAIA